MKRHTLSSATDVRNAFWQTFCVEGKPREFYGRSQNELPTDVRMAFAEFVDRLARAGTISEHMASVVTL